MPPEDADVLHGKGPAMGAVLAGAEPRNTLFTGSQRVAEKLALDLRGKVFLEDAGFDWKVLGPDVADVDYVAWQCDQDAYACSGQKCSAQSMLFAHNNWVKAGLLEKLKSRAASRQLSDLTIGPVLTWTTDAILGHTKRLLEIPGAKLLWGGRPLTGHTIPQCYGAVEPTAVSVPLAALADAGAFEAATTEVFGPFQVVVEYEDSELQLVLDALERMSHHLTAAIVSNDPKFLQHVLAHTVNGTTYAGLRARTTGAPQNHWFGPAGDPRGAGIGTPEAIRLVWSCHREVIYDYGPAPDGAKLKTT
ncbi:1-pyrroline-5-carboxylate dehydrogenase [Monoraphidium neglectum]|uniref:1-pyrroline-5-carboxylate dehydrogenase n=1 Tax=Monoraphidium neglectum TaxID=145388 RepID=A0A0D2JE61_9CHLO|nr:1-pyrroline-5-carboxylate dehydrogenase [Monoraphidium neglectum]KIY97867.1 1-pyrroline-5-carboxylate dehydrogenase [Monoraphidium neglectum]|eukprot:XP_013896887.1 1-pyrroline-5-carboxylate dehydrogenase [Monoraphidium neglectum]